MVGYGSAVISGQLVPLPVKAAFDPLGFGPAYTGPGMWPRNGVYNVPPIMPAPSLQSAQAPAAYGQSGTYPFPTATSPTGNPFHVTKSPVLWGLGFLIVGIGMLHFIHYR